MTMYNVPRFLKEERLVLEAAEAWANTYEEDCLHPERGDDEEVTLWMAVITLRAKKVEAASE